jgi:hypothetical protein
MIASATEGHRATANDDTSVSVQTIESELSHNSDKSHETSDEHRGRHAKANSTSVPISVGISAIAFTKDIVATNGVLHTPVLINVAEQAGTATLVRDGVATTCSVQANPGVVAWLDCSLAASDPTATYQVVVQTVYGKTASHDVAVR